MTATPLADPIPSSPASSSTHEGAQGTRALLRLEGLVLLAAGAGGYFYAGGSGWLFALLFLVPDLSMLGYLAGPRWGAVAYNAGHSHFAPGLLAMVGVGIGVPTLWLLALIWVAHIGFDRALGYGLKTFAGFRHTHLGMVGRVKPASVPVEAS